MFLGFSGQVYVTSRVDNNSYLVNNTINKNEVSDTLAKLKQKTQLLITKVSNKDIQKKLVERTSNTQFKENNKKFPPENETSYTVNKGHQIVLCLVDYNNMQIYDMNTLMYVVIHELAHIANDSFGHDESFYSIFNYLLQESIFAGVYSFNNFDKLPKYYCGLKLKVSSSPP